MLDYKIVYILLFIDMFCMIVPAVFCMIVPAVLRTHKQTRSITLYFILNKYYNTIEQTMLIVFIIFNP